MCGARRVFVEYRTLEKCDVAVFCAVVFISSRNSKHTRGELFRTSEPPRAHAHTLSPRAAAPAADSRGHSGEP